MERIEDLGQAGAATHPLDVTSSLEELKGTCNEIIGIYGRVDYLINNAGCVGLHALEVSSSIAAKHMHSHTIMGAIEEISPEETFHLFNTSELLYTQSNIYFRNIPQWFI